MTKTTGFPLAVEVEVDRREVACCDGREEALRLLARWRAVVFPFEASKQASKREDERDGRGGCWLSKGE